MPALKKPQNWWQRLVAGVLEFFSGLEIKYKLSINIAIIVVMVIVFFSALILPIQRRVLDNATMETCTYLLKKLSQSIYSSLLLNNRTEVQLEVTRTRQMGVKGLQYILIFDRTGALIATSDSIKTGLVLPPATLEALARQETVTVREDASYYEFYYPITARMDAGAARKPLLGVGCVGFARQVLTEPIIHTQRRILAMAALVIVMSVWVIYFFAQKMVDEIHALSRAAREVGNGNLEVSLQPRSNDELGQLAREFNNMIIHLREKLQMQKFLSKLTVQMIHQRGGHRVEPYEGERRNVTILFSDIRNFSAIAEDSEPEQIVKLINIYFDLQTRIIEANGGVVDKFMGDQIMAVFQGPRMIEEAVRAATEIQRAVKELNRQRRAAGEVTFELGIGINQGLAVMGNMGSKNRMDYTVIGDVVNIANRLCNLARSGQIIAEYNIAHSLNGAYIINRLDSIVVKGRSKPVEIGEIGYERDDEL
ncbi:MAG: adenylate/guanylate cyclase domain-containing protein [candidate division KSB1 bacterium]|nr:adenylate/guanylate cyclase domain-containing protein [candidate division KSB1 bacterium]MDZ7275787.1 adenylate/guanylate cyclase domain-containing protein [candidate division KSB1 bacterium]MDZ7287539.1 adenylate/guanylate cyclase domain-containing protein [candidate division KSB1 bacterium]MDZ7307965.1 adenylate/guanylate cyclase domain-containing protein [candidate division KSB1 bacterium]MDZ7350517.1 adenylate/guanylate cyclase domain-containing protein [candidate division KSB1 bacterium